ncbi:MAG: SgcJ/EcaC family oxidoreductase [Acidobacteriales bacterium]|nr:SgcJ/EcaC family oxidoreductase [Terriglobales bacterium]
MQKQLVLALGMAVCLVLNVGCQRPAGLSEADRTAIRQVDETYVKLALANDAKGSVALYTDDATVLPSHHAALQGKAAIQAWMEAPGPKISKFEMRSLEIEGRGDLAYDRGTYSVTVTPAGGTPVEDRGNYLTIFRKQADGAWKLQRDIWTSELPLPEKPAAPVKKR